jgi:hypothetical protein
MARLFIPPDVVDGDGTLRGPAALIRRWSDA